MGVVDVDVRVSSHLKEDLTWAIHKRLRVIRYYMRCYVALSYVFQLFPVKTSTLYSDRKLLRRLANYKVC